MASSIQRATAVAYHLFSRLNGLTVPLDGLAEVSKVLRQVTAPELKLDCVLTEREAPVTYIRIWESKVMSVGVFVLREGRRLPLHDHPGMFGLLKVVHGTVTMSSYSLLDPVKFSLPDSVEGRVLDKHNIVPARFEGSQNISANDDCCVLTPDACNVHEIKSETGIAAFVDILAPPYYMNERPCTYFRDLGLNRENNGVQYLQKTPCPRDYWCDEDKYQGPKLDLPS